MRDNRNDPTPYAVYCAGDNIPGQKPCGLVFLTDDEYGAQLRRPNQGWHCPKCLSCATWDDDCQETNPPEDQEEAPQQGKPRDMAESIAKQIEDGAPGDSQANR